MLSHRAYDPSTMSLAEVKDFTDWLYQCHCKVFGGIDREEFRRYVIEPEAIRTRIEVYSNEAGDAIGYAAVHLYERHFEGRDILVVRMETGLDPKARSGGLTIPFLMEETLRCRAAFPEAEMYYLGCFVSPASFVIFTKTATVSWPHPACETPPEVLSMITGLGDSFQLPCPDPAQPLVRDIGWALHEDDATRRRMARSRRKETQLFLELNPDYAQGKGLLFLMPLNWESLGEIAKGKTTSIAASAVQSMELPYLAEQAQVCVQ